VVLLILHQALELLENTLLEVYTEQALLLAVRNV
jgi:hypothetical protein